jgi:hypothetical protein
MDDDVIEAINIHKIDNMVAMLEQTFEQHNLSQNMSPPRMVEKPIQENDDYLQPIIPRQQ